MKVTWAELLRAEIEGDGGNFDEMVTTLTEEELNQPFMNEWGGYRGLPFTAWCGDWVYFPLCYDGAMSVGRAPRNPCDIAMEWQGMNPI